MKQFLRFPLFVCFAMVGFISYAQTPFTPGNIVVYRTGDGTLGPLNFNAFPVYLDEFTPTGILVRSIKMPVTGLAGSDTTKRITMVGQSNFQGQLSLSTDGQYLMLAGFDAPVGTANVPSSETAAPRSIGRVKYDGTINAITALTDAHVDNGLAGVVSTNGNDIWVSGLGIAPTAGIRYTTLGATTSLLVGPDASPRTNRCLGIYDGQLYAIAHSGSAYRLAKIGTGLPTTSGNLATNQGIPTAGNSFNQFVMLDMDSGIPGVDVIYVTDLETPGGIEKYSLVGGTWTLNGSVGDPAQEYFGLAAKNNNGIVNLFATRNGTNGSSNTTAVNGGELVTLTDASGYNGVFSGSPTSLSTIIGRFGANDFAAYRGVAFVPQAPTVQLSAKAYLGGVYNTGLNRHRDVTGAWVSVQQANALVQPYNNAAFGNYAGTENVLAGAYAATGATTDKVDWVLLELRDQTTPTTVVARKAAFIREDGMIVDVDGTSNVTFTGVSPGSYYVVVRHRNHLMIRSANPVALSAGSATTYDFTTLQSQAFQSGAVTGNPAMLQLGSVFTMAAGDANRNGNVRYTGLNNDAGVLLGKLGGNQGLVQTAQYDPSDFNLDGTVRYTGLNNDAGFILTTLSGNQGNIFNQHP